MPDLTSGFTDFATLGMDKEDGETFEMCIVVTDNLATVNGKHDTQKKEMSSARSHGLC